MAVPRIKSAAVLIGYDSEGHCVYSEILDIHAYYDGDHVWDDPASIKRIKVHRLKGYLFNPKGAIDQEFENCYDAKTGEYLSGKVRCADGTERCDGGGRS